jgi:uncharacterized membrane protein
MILVAPMRRTGHYRLVGDSWLFWAGALTLFVLGMWVYLIWKYIRLRRMGASKWVLISVTALVVLVIAVLDEVMSDSGWNRFVKSWILTPAIIVVVAFVAARRVFPSPPNRDQASD